MISEVILNNNEIKKLDKHRTVLSFQRFIFFQDYGNRFAQKT